MRNKIINRFLDLNLFFKLLTSFLIIICLAILIFVITLSNIKELGNISSNVFLAKFRPAIEISGTLSKIENTRLLLFKYLGTSDPLIMDETMHTIRDISSQSSKEIIDLSKKYPRYRKKLERISETHDLLTAQYTEIIDLHYNFMTSKAYQMINTKSAEYFEEITTYLRKNLKEKETDDYVHRKLDKKAKENWT